MGGDRKCIPICQQCAPAFADLRAKLAACEERVEDLEATLETAARMLEAEGYDVSEFRDEDI